MTTTRMRSILLGGPLCLGTMLAGCPFEDPPMIVDTESTGAVDPTMGTTTPTPTTNDSTTSMPTTNDPTTEAMVDSTTTVSVDDTTTDASSTSTSDPTTGDPCVAACNGLACGDADSCECGMCGPMATCADDQSYCGEPIGYFNMFPEFDSVSGDVQFGFRFTVFEPRTVRRLGLVAAGAGSDIRLALYDHNGTGPANRLVQTGAVTLYADGANEFDVGATPIVPGDYWVLIHTDGLTPLYRTLDEGYEFVLRASVPFADGFPMTMDDEEPGTTYRYNLYMVVEE